MRYEPEQVPQSVGAEGARRFFFRQFRRIASTLAAPRVRELELETHYAAPAKLYDGLTVLADGTSWDPGSGQGVYTYYGAAWNYLG